MRADRRARQAASVGAPRRSDDGGDQPPVGGVDAVEVVGGAGVRAQLARRAGPDLDVGELRADAAEHVLGAQPVTPATRGGSTLRWRDRNAPSFGTRYSARTTAPDGMRNTSLADRAAVVEHHLAAGPDDPDRLGRERQRVVARRSAAA